MDNVTNYCAKCRQETKHAVLFKKKIGSEPGADFGWSEEFKVVECLGCENTSFRKEYCDEEMVAFSNDGDEHSYEDVTIYPTQLNGHKLLSGTYYLPFKIRTVYFETIESFKAKSYLLTAVGFRAIIEAICIEEDIKGNDLATKIKNLSKNKLITEKEEKRLHSIRFLGNDSVHEMMVPTANKLYIVLEIVEHLLRNLYLIDRISMSELDTVIDTYEAFADLLWVKTKKDDPGEQKNLREILGKDIRRVGDKLNLFEGKLIEAIGRGITNFLSLGKVVQGSPSIQYYTKNKQTDEDF